MDLDIVAVEKIGSHTRDTLHNVTIKISGPSRMTLLLFPAFKDMTFEMWGFDDVHVVPSDGEIWKDGKPTYFFQFIQGLHPRCVL